ncbi:RDD family protein [Actinoplanes sp. NPDC051633]|uniref:RDD family protein n=1 Tax=Actinoplanes sp. NPDC051633 TaxID=3155670 RepID=UPI0034131074
MEKPADRLVNGEAVEVDVRYARLGSRALALTVDIAVQVLLGFFLLILVVALVPLVFGEFVDDALMRSIMIIVAVTVLIAYPTTIETLTNGRSIGKRLVGLRVVREDGGPIRVRHALTRTLVGVAVEWPGLIMPMLTWVVSLLTMTFSPRGRRLGDLAAGTFVIHERSASEWGWMPAMPPPLSRWAVTADLSAVDDDLALAARHFLARAKEIRRPWHDRFADGLAAEMIERIPQQPPPGTPPMHLLAAVLAERRRRASGQVLTTRALTERIWPGFGRLENFTRLEPVGSFDAEQTQPLP